MRKFGILCSVVMMALAVWGLGLSAASAQYYIKKNPQDQASDQKGSVYLKNRPKPRSNVYTPSIQNNNRNYVSPSQNRSQPSSRYRAATPPPDVKRNTEVIMRKHKCSDDEYRIYQTMRKNDQRMIQAGKRMRESQNENGEFEMEYTSAEDEKFSRAYMRSYNKMMRNPSQKKRYLHISSECSYRAVLERR